MEEYARLCSKRRAGEEKLDEGVVDVGRERGREVISGPPSSSSSSSSSSQRQAPEVPAGGAWWDAVCLFARGQRQKELFESLVEFRKLNAMIPTFNNCMYLVVDIEDGGAAGQKFSVNKFLKELNERMMREGGKHLEECKVSFIYSSIEDLWMEMHPWGEMFAPCSHPVLPHVQTSTMVDFKLSSMLSLAAHGKAGIYLVSVGNVYLLDPFSIPSRLQLRDHKMFALGRRQAAGADEARGVLIANDEAERQDESIVRCNRYMRRGEQEQGDAAAEQATADVGVVPSDLYIEHELFVLLAETLEHKPYKSLVDGILASAFSCNLSMEEENKENLVHLAISSNRELYMPCVVAGPSETVRLGRRQAEAGKTSSVLGSYVDSSSSVEGCSILNSSLHSVTAQPASRIELSTIIRAEGQEGSHTIGRSSTVSGVFYSHPTTPLVLPEDVRLLSFPILSEGGGVKFLTAFTGASDDLEEAPVRRFLNLPVEAICERQGSLRELLAPPHDLLHAPLFPLHEDPTTSVLLALHAIHQLLGNEQDASLYARAIPLPLTPQKADRTSLHAALPLFSSQQCYVKFAPLPGPCLQSVTFHNLHSCWSFPARGVRPAQVQLPARLIVAGGWTDTPPVCFMHPGGIFNLSCRLDGQDPLQARVEVVGGERLELCSEDQQAEEGYGSWEELYEGMRAGGHALSPWRTMGHESCTAVHAAVISVLFDSNLYGRISSQASSSSPSPFPRGIRLLTNSLLPKGSGLGGSSILALACVRALEDACGLEMSLRQEMDAVLMVEQLLGTGGGWQDQIGCEPGAKFTTRDQGGYHVSRVSMSEEHAALLNSRLLCLGTSMTRVAKTVLVGVVDKFCSGDFNIVSILGRQLELNARSMRDKFLRFAACSLREEEELEACLRDIGEELERYREHCEGLQGSTFMPESLRPIFAAMAGYTYGANLMGAGNGGFIVGVVKAGRNKEEVLLACQQVAVTCGVSLTLANVEVTV
ncbi:hypothetical protein GUITHDRAFT_146616 [Guillardia theta CCMP2712]|uniref:GHMP kinase N-terminal domain-containing protein n=1 Tax=Guillardia theta (strain CCMP2712) TaxID=905079 RepID=L1IHD9_GUITC|nr:hypothetical protein GUITHDRAFT_146616 [Guillardia theta CCMP2712]EKX35314.1 hypothetical protein GUITHDRAFT_146616 [Guillardia theta CCMP2712]|eukprot:XP_005822294.1 hypothetical protein GUITHDRAFT_146616 [Guillardia theta CCMP2712]